MVTNPFLEVQVILHPEHLHTVPNVTTQSEDTKDLATPNISCNFCPNTTCISTPSPSPCTCEWHKANKINNRKQQAPQPVPQTSHLTVIGNHYLDVSEWLLPPHICQSMIGGRQTGSNACTIISMLTGLHFLEESLPIPKQLQDLSHTIPVYSQLIFKGNHIYSSFNLPPQEPNLDVKQVLDKKDENLQNLAMITDNGFFSPQDLGDYIEQYHRHNPKFAAVLIVPSDKSMALCFNQAVMCLFESHSHGLRGPLYPQAVLAISAILCNTLTEWSCGTGRLIYMGQIWLS